MMNKLKQKMVAPEKDELLYNEIDLYKSYTILCVKHHEGDDYIFQTDNMFGVEGVMNFSAFQKLGPNDFTPTPMFPFKAPIIKEHADFMRYIQDGYDFFVYQHQRQYLKDMYHYLLANRELYKIERTDQELWDSLMRTSRDSVEITPAEDDFAIKLVDIRDNSKDTDEHVDVFSGTARAMPDYIETIPHAPSKEKVLEMYEKSFKKKRTTAETAE